MYLHFQNRHYAVLRIAATFNSRCINSTVLLVVSAVGNRNLLKTTLYSNLRRMCAFSYAWSLPITRQRCRSYHVIRRIQKSHATCKRKLHGSVFYRTGVIDDRNFTLQDWAFWTFCSCDLDLDPMTFMYKLDPYYLEMYRMCKTKLPTSRLSRFPERK